MIGSVFTWDIWSRSTVEKTAELVLFNVALAEVTVYVYFIIRGSSDEKKRKIKESNQRLNDKRVNCNMH